MSSFWIFANISSYLGFLQMQSVFTDILSFYPHTSNVRLPGQVQDTHSTDEKTRGLRRF